MWALFLTAILIFGDVCAGKAMQVTAIKVEGQRWTKSWVIERELKISIGDTIRPEALERICNRLLNLGLFSRVEVTASNNGEIIVDLVEAWHLWPIATVHLEETQLIEFFDDPRRFFEGVSFDLGVIETNLAGTGAHLFGIVRVGASSGGLITYQTRWFSRALPLAVRAHYRNLIMTDRHAAVLGINHKLHNIRAEMHVGTREGALSRIGFKLRYDQVKQEPLYSGVGAPHDKTGLVGVFVILDRRDLEWYPSKGGYAWLEADFIGGDRHYFRSKADLRAFWPLSDGRRPLVLALHMLGGTASAGMPPWGCWFSGFHTGFRGYRTREREADGYLSGAVEIRFPLTKIVYVDLPFTSVFRELPLGLNGLLFAERTELRLGRRRWELLTGGVGLACRVPYVQILEVDITFPVDGHYEVGATVGMTF